MPTTLELIEAEQRELDVRRMKAQAIVAQADRKLAALAQSETEKQAQAAQAARLATLQKEFDAQIVAMRAQAATLNAETQSELQSIKAAFTVLANVPQWQTTKLQQYAQLAHTTALACAEFSDLFRNQDHMVGHIDSLITASLIANLTPNLNSPAAALIRRELSWHNVAITEMNGRSRLKATIAQGLKDYRPPAPEPVQADNSEIAQITGMGEPDIIEPTVEPDRPAKRKRK